MPRKAVAELDLSEFTRFMERAPGAVLRALDTYFRFAEALLRKEMVNQAKARFGKEQAQSRMKTYDPSRPTGSWAGSITAFRDRKGMRIGPTVTYADWVERGIHAVDDPHPDTTFVGHHPVERASDDAMPTLAVRAERMARQAVEDAAR